MQFLYQGVISEALQVNYLEEIEEVLFKLKINHIVIWGVKSSTHSHFYIHYGFFINFKKLNIKTHWVENSYINNQIINKNTLVISLGDDSSQLECKDKVWYCIHNPVKRYDDFGSKYYLILQVITNYNEINKNNIKLQGHSYFSKIHNTLFQSWGSPIEYRHFQKPNININSRFEFFIGSIWDNSSNQGNKLIIDSYRNLLESKKIKFVHCRGIPEKMTNLFLRHSKYAITILGDWQVREGYVPCRLFKAISNGRLGISNGIRLRDMFTNLFVDTSIENLIEKYESIRSDELSDIIIEQQKEIKFETYIYKIFNIIRTFEIKENT